MSRKTVQIKTMLLGDGVPKICVPLTATSPEKAREQLAVLAGAPCDMIELRADYFLPQQEERFTGEGSLMLLPLIRTVFPELPVLFTFRTLEEGGQQRISPGDYRRLNLAAAASGFADLIDVEINRGEEVLRQLAREIRDCGAKTVASFHDFGGTPQAEQLLCLLRRMQELGADVTKAAVMPQSEQDVLTLLQVSVEMKRQYADRPYITMSMGRTGGISRLAGALTGSCVTFASAAESSAPGQMDAKLVASVLSVL